MFCFLDVIYSVTGLSFTAFIKQQLLGMTYLNLALEGGHSFNDYIMFNAAHLALHITQDFGDHTFSQITHCIAQC